MSLLLVGCQPRNRRLKMSQSSGWDPYLRRPLHHSRQWNTRRDPRRALDLVFGSKICGVYVEWGLYTCAEDVFAPHAVGGCRGNVERVCEVCGREGRAQQGEDVEWAWDESGDCMDEKASVESLVYHQRTPIRALQTSIR